MTDTILLAIGTACLCTLFAEVVPFTRTIKTRMFRTLQGCWERKYSDAEIDQMYADDLLKSQEDMDRMRIPLNQLRRPPLWLRPFIHNQDPVHPDDFEPDAFIHFKPFECGLCMTWWTSLPLAYAFCQDLPEVILQIGGAPILAALISKQLKA